MVAKEGKRWTTYELSHHIQDKDGRTPCEMVDKEDKGDKDRWTTYELSHHIQDKDGRTPCEMVDKEDKELAQYLLSQKQFQVDSYSSCMPYGYLSVRTN